MRLLERTTGELMNKKQAIIKEFREQFTYPVGTFHIVNKDISYEAIEQFLSQKLDEYGEEILVFLDELEMKQPEDLKTDNWRNWKYIRNSLRDWFDNKGQNDKD